MTLQQLCQITIGEAVLLGLDEQIVGRQPAAMLEDLLFQLDQLLHLLDEPRLDVGPFVQSLHVGAFAERFVHEELPLTGRLGEHSHQFVQRPLVEILGEAQSVPAGFQRADRLLQCLLVVLADAHHLADGQHLCAQLVRQARELLEGPAGEFHHHVVAPRLVLLQRSQSPIGNLVHRHPAGQQRRDERNRKSRGLGGQRRGARRPRIDLDHDHAARLGIVGELDIGPADHLNRLDDVVRVLLQLLLQLLVDGQHRGRAVGVAGVDSHGIDVLDEADRDHLVLGVPDDLQLQFLPTQHRLLDEDLPHQAGGQPALGDGAKLVHVEDQPAAGSAHRVCRPNHRRQTDPLDNLLGLFETLGDLAAGHLDAQPVHRVLEGLAVFAPLDGVDLNADHPDAVFVQHSGAVKLRRQVQARLTAQIGQQRVGLLLGHDVRQTVERQRLDVGRVGHAGIGHDRRRVGVHQDDLVSQLAKGLAGLGAGVVKLAGLTDDDRT